MEETASLARSCPACGAAMPQQARFCGVCGADSQASPERQPAVSEVPAAQTVAAAPDESSDVAAAVEPSPLPPPPMTSSGASVADGRACPWCGAINSKNAASCAACDAVFPTPEGDAALERAAQERISAMEGALRQRRSWWPFGSR